MKIMPTEKCTVILIPGKYGIHIVEPGETLDIKVGFTKGDGLYYKNPLAVTNYKKFEFKHSNSSGAKWWTSEQGATHTFTVPRSSVSFCDDETGYSYPKIMIGGEEIVLTTSGGGMAEWIDWIYPEVETCVNGPLSWLAALEKIAIKKENKLC